MVAVPPQVARVSALSRVGGEMRHSACHCVPADADPAFSMANRADTWVAPPQLSPGGVEWERAVTSPPPSQNRT
jgi:hypothetical protein